MWIREWYERKKNKEGAYSVITITLALILVIGFTAYTDILTKSYTLNEVQQRLDTAGLNTLNKSINTEHLMLEELAIDNENRSSTDQTLINDLKSRITQTYKEEVHSAIRTNDTIKDIQVRRVDVALESTNFGTGVEGESRPQLALDALLYLEVKNSQEFDMSGSSTQEFYDARSGNNFTIELTDVEADGVTGMLIRSSTRVVYR